MYRSHAFLAGLATLVLLETTAWAWRRREMTVAARRVFVSD